MKSRDGHREPVYPGTFLNRIEGEKIEFNVSLTGEFVKDVSNNEEGLAFLEEYEKLVVEGVVF